jgi:hypothetical protein
MKEKDGGSIEGEKEVGGMKKLRRKARGKVA